MGRVTNIFKGLSYNFSGLKFFLREKSLWKFTLIPIIINFFILGLFVTVFFSKFSVIFDFLLSPLGGLDIANPTAWYWHILDAGLWFLRMILKVVTWLLSFVILLVGTYFISHVVNGPFYEMMAEKVLILKGRFADRTFSFSRFARELLHSLKLESFKLVLFFCVSALLMLLSFIPFIGFVFTVLQFAFSAWFFAFGLCAYPFVVEEKPLRQILSWGLHQKAKLLGFGIPSLIPVLGILFIPVQVVGGALLFVDAEVA